MADQLNMNGLSLNDSQHAGPNGMGGGRAAYIPPHLRNAPQSVRMDGPPPTAGMNASAWAGPTA